MPTWVLPAIGPAGGSAYIDEMPTLLMPALPGLGGPGNSLATTKVQTAIQAGVRGVENYALLVWNLAKSSGIYALASLGAPFISLVLAPFLAHHLAPEDYGALAVLNTAIGLGVGLTQLGLGSAFFRSYNYDYSARRDKLDVLATVVALLLLISVPMAIVIAIAAPPIATALLGSAELGRLVTLAAIVLVLQNCALPGLSWLRADNRAGLYSALALGNLVVALVANIVLVGVLHLGVAGALLATGVGYAVQALCTIPVILVRAGLKVRWDVAWGLLSFGVPQVASFISMWVLGLSDRYLLSRFESLAQTASYSVAYNMGSVVSTVVLTPFGLAWPTAMYAIAKRKDAGVVFKYVFRGYLLLTVFACFTLSFAGTELLYRLFPPSYRAAAPVIPFASFSLALYAAYNQFMTGVSLKRKTWYATIFVAVAAILNVGINLILIPRYGPLGAAISTLAAYVVLAAVAYVANQRLYKVPYEIGRFTIALIGSGILYAASYMLPPLWGASWNWEIGVVASIICAGWLVMLGGGPKVVRQLKRRGPRPKLAGAAHHS
jgi:O-antigen/teichoic acid export membrane protein